MILLIFLLSIVALAASILVPGYSDFVMLSGPIAVASLVLLGRDLLWRRGGRSRPKAAEGGPPTSVFRKDSAQSYVVIDGSNVMHWKDGAPDLATVVAVVQTVQSRGQTPGVIFDANAGYKIGQRYQDDKELARRLGLPEDRVLVVPKGTPADKYILEAARQLKAKVVSNDRYRDWAESFPEVQEPGFLLRGGIKDGAVWLG